ncbi:MAG: prepilin peptidase, partial [Planctomycetaceae bacterium]
MNPLQLPLWLIIPLLACVGAAIGRFLNICIDRFPEPDLLRDQLKSLFHPWTVCQRCGTKCSGRDHLPMIGWLLNHGRCRKCGSRITPRYPIIEAVTAVLFVIVYWRELVVGPSGSHGFGGLTSIEGPAGPEVITT